MSESDIKPKRRKKSAAKADASSSPEEKIVEVEEQASSEVVSEPAAPQEEKKAPDQEALKPTVPSGMAVEITPASDFSILKAETSASVVFGLMAVMGTIMYFSYTAFKDDYLLLFCGLFVFLGVYPSLNLKVSNPNSKIILEVSIAFALCMGVFLVLKAMQIPPAEHNKMLIIFVTLLGMRYIFFPAYNVGVAEDQKASS